MPVYYHSSSRKSNGFSIDDIIKNEVPSKTSYIPPITWFSSPMNLYQFQRESMLQYLRHANPGAAVAAALFLNSYRKPKRNRTAFTPSQLMKLENEFEKNHYIVGQERKDLAKHLNLPEAKVKVWYQNRRTKYKRLITEGSEIDHQNDSDTSDPIINIDDEHSWNTEDTPNHIHRTPKQENS